MFSTRVVVVLAACALVTVAAYPARDAENYPVTTIDDQFTFPWMNLSPFSLFAPLWKLIPTFVDIGPRIITEKDKFQVVVNCKDYKVQDLKVKVKGDFIFVQGSQDAKEDDHDVFTSQFFHTYSLPLNASAENVKAELTSDGYLVVSVKIDGSGEQSKNVDRVVPIVETGAPYKKEENVDKTTVETVEVASDKVTTAEPKTSAPEATTAAAEDDNKEPTTPAVPEEATDKDNVIPHGNEIPV